MPRFRLVESGLSKLNDYMSNYDIACVSAKKYLPTRQDYQTQHDFETEYLDRLGKQKRLDNKALSILLKAKYKVSFAIKGFYQYNKESKPDKENSYCIVNVENNPNFKNDILEIGKLCKQNSIFYSPKGTFEGYWIYTGVDLSEPDEIDKQHNFGDKEYRGVVHFGSYKTTDDGTGYSLINGRPFGAYEDGDGQVKTNVNEMLILSNYNPSPNFDDRTITSQDGRYFSDFRKLIPQLKKIVDK